MATKVTVPKPTLSTIDAVALIVGMVVGVAIFKTPAVVAQNTQSAVFALLAWLLGGAMSLVGALCYAELTTAYPDAGGTYHYLMRAFGKGPAFLFAWARMTVIQTGSIALAAFVFGDYAAQLLPIGEYSSAIYAAGVVVCLTALNVLGVQQGKWTQNWLTAAKVLGLLLIVIVSIAFAVQVPQQITTAATQKTAFGQAMIYVLLTYGGWNEAAYISAEVRDGKRNMVRALLGSIAIITAIFLLINLAFIYGLGVAGLASSEAPTADLMRRAVGENGARFVSFLIAISALGAVNATIFTGARTNYALGRDFRKFSFLGRWQESTGTPKNALLVQGAISLALVVLGALTPREGFETMVNYTAPVFWFFFLLSGVALLVLRSREPDVPRPFRVPLYPWTPLLFCATCSYLLYSSLTYAGIGGITGVVVLLTGIPLLLLNRQRTTSTNP
ncbi:putative amino acid transporter [Scytonema sp. HK-05]|uniref:APC family permease n=1 Tax=Scytonema sp. HK-05 TaxID=1137095 RepID=UPI000935C0D8|nr:amino acid permease [Scytonema sp. HK-05]OKH50421.1 amino acid permease [Scytonema sp. HK-05]BAY46572.1 putative amino acid transporter [Scytonema sp. HK-05]